MNGFILEMMHQRHVLKGHEVLVYDKTKTIEVECETCANASGKKSRRQKTGRQFCAPSFRLIGKTILEDLRGDE